MVFENNPGRAKAFFSRLLFQHFQATDASGVDPIEVGSAEELLQLVFTQNRAFDEFVRAAEGVPRDAINILALAATKAQEKKISIPDIWAAAAQWFDQDKSQVMIHVLKRSISGHDEPGVRYRAYKIDYGCYVELLKTARAPQGLLQGVTETGEEHYFDVPPDDYRAIRRSILDMNEFDLQTIERQLPKGKGFRWHIAHQWHIARTSGFSDEDGHMQSAGRLRDEE
jgi:hypothetical protein